MSRALIFGAGGQDGFYLTKYLRDLGWLVCAQDHKGCDVTNYDAVAKKVFAIRPDHIYQLAGRSTTSHSVLVSEHDAITRGTENVLEAVRKLAPDARVFVPGSAMQFHLGGDRISRWSPFVANSPYAIARIHATQLARYYRDHVGLKVHVGYLFNHESPRRPPHHMAQRIALAARNKTKFRCANLDVMKEHAFAGDVVEAMVLLMEQDTFDDVIIATGIPYTIRYWAELCYREVGLDYRKFVEGSDEKVEYMQLYGDPVRIRSLGWEPKVNIEALAKMMVKGGDE